MAQHHLNNELKFALSEFSDHLGNLRDFFSSQYIHDDHGRSLEIVAGVAAVLRTDRTWCGITIEGDAVNAQIQALAMTPIRHISGSDCLTLSPTDRRSYDLTLAMIEGWIADRDTRATIEHRAALNRLEDEWDGMTIPAPLFNTSTVSIAADITAFGTKAEIRVSQGPLHHELEEWAGFSVNRSFNVPEDTVDFESREITDLQILTTLAKIRKYVSDQALASEKCSVTWLRF